MLDDALDLGCTRQTYTRLLDPSTPHGRVAAACTHEYSTALGISEDGMRRLRLLCWIVHCRSDYLHFEMEATGTPTANALRRSVFLGLAKEELSQVESLS